MIQQDFEIIERPRTSCGFTDLVIIEDDEADISGSALYEAFRDWCFEEGINAWSRRAFFAAITERYPNVREHKKKTGSPLRRASTSGRMTK